MLISVIGHSCGSVTVRWPSGQIFSPLWVPVNE